ncbi:hypothetical protein BSIN_1340 [Burkholderia singularis]|uniref:Uncharacterized protein n=1 Tax=Burkholderia singularis TaxID=1503053 RepID=A0A238GYH4_9BURK|nr:hypothetical protein BSIN_1340 [Burkholderia singularis]
MIGHREIVSATPRRADKPDTPNKRDKTLPDTRDADTQPTCNAKIKQERKRREDGEGSGR